MVSLANNNFLVLAVLLLVALLLLFEGVFLFWRAYKGPKAKKLERRLQALSASRDRSSQLQLLRNRMLSELPILEQILQQLPRMHMLDRMILQSGLNWTVSKLLLTCAAASGVTLMVLTSIAHQSVLFSLGVALGVGSLPLLYLQRKRQQRLRRINGQLPDALDLLTRALRAGHALTSALKMSGEEMADPIATEFRTVHDEINFGVSLEQSLSHLCDRVPSTDLRYFVVAVLIQRDSGGNLTEILSDLSTLIRERAQLIDKIRILSTESRLSAWILGLLPLLLGGALYVMNPTFMAPLFTDPLGISIVQTLLFMMVMGAIMLRQIARIRV